jgi:uroporphyrinogen-III synthase
MLAAMVAQRIRGVVVTRPVGRGRALARALAARGLAVASLPGSAIGPPDGPAAARAALAAARRADVAIFASPAAVAAAFRLAPELGFDQRTRILAPGPGTRTALARRGIAAQCPAERFDSEGLLALPALARPTGLRVALLGAASGRDLLPRTLAARGAVVTRVAVHVRRAARLDRRHLARFDALPSPIASLWSSAEAVANVLGQLSEDRRLRLSRGLGVASGARIAATLRAHGFGRVVTAASARPADLVTALLEARNCPEIASRLRPRLRRHPPTIR